MHASFLRRLAVMLGGATLLVALTPAVAHADSGVTTLVSVSDTGGDGNGNNNSDSTRPALSADGTFVVFSSKATNLVPNDSTTFANVYERNTSTGTTSLASVSDTGGWPNGSSTFPDVSGDGQYVVFESLATNLLPNDTAPRREIYRYDTSTGTLALVSVSYTGGFASGNSTRPTISDDGRYVCFNSTSRDLVRGDHTYVGDEVYVRDTVAGTTTRVSVTPSGGDPNGDSVRCVISADGTHVAFQSAATNLVASGASVLQNIYERDLTTGVTGLVSVSDDGSPANGGSVRPSISADGQYVAFQSAASNLVANDTNGVLDVFRRDMVNGITIRVSVNSKGHQLMGASTRASISGDGNLVAFASNDYTVAAGYNAGYRNVYVRDISTGTNTLIGLNYSGTPGSCSAVVSRKGCLATRPAVSSGGNAIAFVSTFTDLTSNATTGVAEVFERVYSTGL